MDALYEAATGQELRGIVKVPMALRLRSSATARLLTVMRTLIEKPRGTDSRGFLLISAHPSLQEILPKYLNNLPSSDRALRILQVPAYDDPSQFVEVVRQRGGLQNNSGVFVDALTAGFMDDRPIVLAQLEAVMQMTADRNDSFGVLAYGMSDIPKTFGRR